MAAGWRLVTKKARLRSETQNLPPERGEGLEMQLLFHPAYVRKLYRLSIVQHQESFQISEHICTARVTLPTSKGTEAPELRTVSDPTCVSLHLAPHLYPLSRPLLNW